MKEEVVSSHPNMTSQKDSVRGRIENTKNKNKESLMKNRKGTTSRFTLPEERKEDENFPHPPKKMF